MKQKRGRKSGKKPFAKNIKTILGFPLFVVSYIFLK
jgi:hypothetical protein